LAIETDAEWPLVDIPHFELRGRLNNELSKALMISYSPLVTSENRANWEDHAFAEQGWIQEGIALSPDLHEGFISDDFKLANISKDIFRFSDGETGLPVLQDRQGTDFGPGHYAPVWEQAPAPHDPSIINFDLLSHPVFNRVYHGMWETKLPVMSEVTDLDFFYGGAIREAVDHPQSFLMYPVYPYFGEDVSAIAKDDLVGFLVVVLQWDRYFTNILREGVNGMVVVLHSTCGDHYTYRLDGPEVIFVGEGDHHDTSYDYMEVAAEFMQKNLSDTNDYCEYGIRIYPSKMMEASYTSNKPLIYTIVVVLVFIFAAVVFIFYDYLVQMRHNKVMMTAKRTNAIAASLFPSNVRDRMLKDAEEQAERGILNKTHMGVHASAKNRLKDYLDDADDGMKTFESKPIADLFPHTTIMFADIAGFTAWSSSKEPSQVFTLLENIYQAFDEIARRRRVFKVETIGDCYVAVCGLPQPRKDHAIVMARFARDCMTKMNDLTKKLEVTLGPDTADLSIRVGLHSGPVTAGVLRGDKSRFQLFGDTMNTTARIETTGAPNHIHISSDTAKLIMASGKKHWLKKRDEVVFAKGKGEMVTYWLVLRAHSSGSTRSGSSNTSAGESEDLGVPMPKDDILNPDDVESPFTAKVQRLIEWNVNVLADLLKQIDISQHATGKSPVLISSPDTRFEGGNESILDEVQEIITLPRFDKSDAEDVLEDKEKCVELSDEVMSQLHNYVATIASLYRDNPFHNFEHASHVTMSVVKLLSRIVAPSHIHIENVASLDDKETIRLAGKLHDHTYGITSDPLTQFAVVFSALIHDVDHTGVPNSTLVNEKAAIAALYNSKSVAEQNSVDIAWGILMDSEYDELRASIYSDATGLEHFRQLVVNSVMATDIMDKEANSIRSAKWDKAFKDAEDDDASITELDTINRKATIVIEHLLQASDVSHTMQHWQVFIEWNEKLFHELYRAYKEGRSDKDPSEFWYEGEIGFFDFYIIPLAMKLKTCGVFGVSSDEYLNYAKNNRSEWERTGKEAIEGYVKQYLADENVECDLPALKNVESDLPAVKELTSKGAPTLVLPHSLFVSASEA
jgi:class 3 adenylate cyclase